MQEGRCTRISDGIHPESEHRRGTISSSYGHKGMRLGGTSRPGVTIFSALLNYDVLFICTPLQSPEQPRGDF